MLDQMKLIRLIILILAWSSAFSREAESCARVLECVDAELACSGVLKSTGGFVYVDVEDAYVHRLISLIQEEGFVEPPYFGSGLVGAHISVIYPDEMNQREIEECDKMIQFTPITCEIVHPLKWNGIDEVYFIVVEAPELDQVREKYGLPKREYAFHITIGIKPRPTLQ